MDPVLADTLSSALTDVAGGETTALGSAAGAYRSAVRRAAAHSASPAADRSAAVELFNTYKEISKLESGEAFLKAKDMLREHMEEIVASDTDGSTRQGKMAAALLGKMDSGADAVGQPATGTVEERYAAVRSAIARRRQAQKSAVADPSGQGTQTAPVSGSTGPVGNSVEQCVAAELARASEYMDDPAYREAASRTGVSVQTYAKDLYDAYIAAGGDPESEQAEFLRSIAGNPEFGAYTVDRIATEEFGEGAVTFLSISDGQGNGIIGVSTDVPVSSYASDGSEYTAEEQALSRMLSEASQGYDRFDVAGIGSGGDAAAIAAMQQEDEVLSHIGAVTTVNSDGFSKSYIGNHAEDVQKIAGRTGNYLPASRAGGSSDALSYLSEENGNYIGKEAYVSAADGSKSDDSWMNWPVEKDGSFDTDYEYTPSDQDEYEAGLWESAAASAAAEAAYDMHTDSSVPDDYEGGSGSRSGGGGGSSGGGGSGSGSIHTDSSGGADDDLPSGGSSGGGGGGGGSSGGGSIHTDSSAGQDDDLSSGGSSGESGGDSSTGDNIHQDSSGGGGFDGYDDGWETENDTDKKDKTEPGEQNKHEDQENIDDSGFEEPEKEPARNTPGENAKSDDESWPDDSGWSDAGGSGSGSAGQGGGKGSSGGGSSGGMEKSKGNGGSTVEITFVPDEVLDCASDLIGIMNKMDTYKGQMEGSLNLAARIWICGSSNSIRKLVSDAVNGVMDECHNTLEQTAQKLCRTEENYAKAEKANMQENSSVSSLFSDDE